MDFGIASLAGETRLTGTGEVVGTLAYMAPEQADGGEVGEAVDVYSLALTLYECWAGFNPVAGGTPAATARRIGAPVPPLADERPDLPPELCAAIDDCLGRDPALRPELLDLADVLSGELDALDDEHLLPAGEPAGQTRERSGRVARLAVAVGLMASLWALAGPAELPGLALVLGLLCAPAVIFAAAIERALVPALAPVLGAVTLGIAYPAFAGRQGEGLERAALGALGWFWLAAGAVALGFGRHLAPVAASGWTKSASAAYHQVLVPLGDLHSLAAAAAFGVAAWAIGPIVRARHVALALVGAVLWAAGLTAVVEAMEPAVASTPIVALAAVTLVIWLERRHPGTEPVWRRLQSPFAARATARTAQR